MAELEKSFKASLSSVSLLLLLLLWLNLTERPSMAATEIQVGVILDLNSKLGSMLNHSIAVAVRDYYSNHTNTTTKIDLIVQDFSQKTFDKAVLEGNTTIPISLLSAYKLMKNEKVYAILGPQNSEQARPIVRLGEAFQKPVIWFPMTGPSLLPPPSPSSIYSGQGLNCYQFQAIAATISSLGWASIVPIYEDTEYGNYLVPCLTNVLKEMSIRMVNITAIDSDSTDNEIRFILWKLKTMRTHAFLVHMSMDLGTKFILAAQRRNMMSEGYAWILTQELSSLTDPQVEVIRNLYNGSIDPVGEVKDFVSLKRYMAGALGVRPMDSSGKKELRRDRERNFERNFTINFGGTLTIYGWWAYHAIEALAQALEKTVTNNNVTKLGEEIKATTFTGVSGVKFNLSQGQLDQSEYEVYNVISGRERIIGSWSPKTGLEDYSEGGGGGEASDGREYHLKDPLWPGDTLDKPPKLRIGVPRTNSSPEFVSVYNSSKVRVDGFAYHVFLKTLDVLPFPLNNYEFVPLPNTRSNNTTFDDMICTRKKEECLLNQNGSDNTTYDDMLCTQMKEECLLNRSRSDNATYDNMLCTQMKEECFSSQRRENTTYDDMLCMLVKEECLLDRSRSDNTTNDYMLCTQMKEECLLNRHGIDNTTNHYRICKQKKEECLLNRRGSNNTTYDDMLCTQMKEENLDAIIGDITILASRTDCVDFTLPYLDSNVAMVVRVTNATSKGILFKPFKWSLWLTLGGIFVAATIIIIILEKYKTNGRNKIKEFRFNPFLVYKIDVMENFASSTAGWMVILTSLLFILIVQVYTATLTSILTQGNVKEPSFKNEKEINERSIVCVGHRNRSWVRGLLIEQIGFKDTQLKPLGSLEEYNEELSRGAEKGGVDAIFDETPYLSLFLSQYKPRFMMTGLLYETGGFAFAFPKKSSLGSHFSNAILKVTKEVGQYRLLMAKSYLPTSVEDLDFEDKTATETSRLSISNFEGLCAILVSLVVLFLCLSIPYIIRSIPSVINRLGIYPSLVIELWRKKQSFKLAKNV